MRTESSSRPFDSRRREITVLTGGPRRWVAVLLLLLMSVMIRPVAAQQTETAATPRNVLLLLPRAPLGAHCYGAVVCTDLGAWGVHARLTGAGLIRNDGKLPGGMLTPAASFTFGGWGEVGSHFPILLGPIGTDPMPLPPLLFAKATFTPPWWIGTHGLVFATLTLPDGPFAVPDEKGQPISRTYEVGGALSGHLLWMLHYGISVSGQLSPGGLPPRLLSGLHVEARLDGWHLFAQATHSVGFCRGGSSEPDCQSNVTLLSGIRIPLVAGHSSVAAGLVRGASGRADTAIMATMGLSYDEETRVRYGDGIEKIEKLWKRFFNEVIDPYLDERCLLLDDDHKPMVELGSKSTDGVYCHRPGLRTRVGTHFDRNIANTRVCYDSGLRNCILHRRSDKDAWEVVPPEFQARRPHLMDDCHVYEAGAKLPLQEVGFKSEDGKACLWAGRRFPIGTEFWAVPGEDIMCEDATLKKCSIGLPPKPMITAQYVGSRAGQTLQHEVSRVLDKFESIPQVASDVASGRWHVGTVASEAYETLKDGLGRLNVEEAKKRAQAVKLAGQEWLDQPLHRQLGDMTEILVELPVKALENEVTGGLGSLTGGVGAASTGARVEKVLVKGEKALVKGEKEVAEHLLPAHIPSGPYEHIPNPRTAGPGKPYSASQKNRLRQENRTMNGGELRSDGDGRSLLEPQQHRKGVSPPANEAHIDHHVPRIRGGSNTTANARVLSREENLKKGGR